MSEWARCRPLIEAALATSPGLETIEDVERMLLSGGYQLWATDKSAAVIEIAEYLQKKALIVVHGGGDLDDLLTVLEPQLCEHARAVGCHLIMGTGRLGWKRPAEQHGYALAFITMYKELKH